VSAEEAGPSASSCFWELNRRCEFDCLHCRADAGPAGDGGLPLQQVLEIADQIVALGVQRVTLTGGEPMSYPGWDRVSRRLADGGARVVLFTSGVELDVPAVEHALSCGVSEFAVSLDGPRAIHNALRPPAAGRPRSAFDAVYAALEALSDRGATTWVVTQVNRENVEHLDGIHQILRDLGVRLWKVHLCQATGRARLSSSELVCDPSDLEHIVGTLMGVAREGSIVAPLTCSIGYLTEEELMLRGRGGARPPVWAGCNAGLRTFAITSRGAVKGCVVLPDEFANGDLSERSLETIWCDESSFPYSRGWKPSMLAGACALCGLSERCRAGCPAVAYGATGSIGANPYCLRLVRSGARAR